MGGRDSSSKQKSSKKKRDKTSSQVRLSIINYQLFRHVELPGWKLSWAWPGEEVIWDILGAEVTERGNCSKFKTKVLPHCCDKEPVITDLLPGAPYKIDLLPGAPYNSQASNCCRGGVLSSMLQEPRKSIAAFEMHIGSASSNSMGPGIPVNFTVGVPGYTCGEAFKVPPTKFSEDQGRRRTQALATWNVSCSHSQFRASMAPTCCVSLSAFYNNTIVPCPQCNCACQSQPGSNCLRYDQSPASNSYTNIV